MRVRNIVPSVKNPPGVKFSVNVQADIERINNFIYLKLSPTMYLRNDDMLKLINVTPNASVENWYVINMGDKLGAGSYGSVYPAYQVENGKITHQSLRVAVKVISQDGFDESEFKMASRYMTVYPPLQHDGQWYCFTELLNGITLSNAVSSSMVSLSLAERVALILQTALQIQHMHERNDTLHCDLKAENIMYVKNPNTGRNESRVIDFGLAKKIEPGVATVYHKIDGNPFYFSPETWASDFSKTTDVAMLVDPFARLLGTENPYLSRAQYLAGINKTVDSLDADQKLALWSIEPNYMNVLPFPEKLAGVSVRQLTIDFLQYMRIENHAQRPNMDMVVKFFIAVYQYLVATQVKDPIGQNEIIDKAIATMLYINTLSSKSTPATAAEIMAMLSKLESFQDDAFFNKAVLRYCVAIPNKNNCADILKNLVSHYSVDWIYNWFIFESELTTHLQAKKRRFFNPVDNLNRVLYAYKSLFGKNLGNINTINFHGLLSKLSAAIPANNTHEYVELKTFLKSWKVKTSVIDCAQVNRNANVDPYQRVQKIQETSKQIYLMPQSQQRDSMAALFASTTNGASTYAQEACL